MLTWFVSWFWKPSVGEKPDAKPRPIILAQGRHSLSPYRVLDWYSQHVDHQLDPLPPFPKGEAPPSPYPESPKTLPPEKPAPAHRKG